jgi:intracellular sulfur oxidation DsrE/DsrF family protein
MQYKTFATIVVIFSAFWTTQSTFALNTDEQVNQLISAKEAPAGVVFEIVTGSATSLNWALPKARNYITKLRTQFPKLDIAIVTHGNEQFALKTNNDQKYKKIHSLTQQLVKDEHIPVHVCGTYAGWKGVSKEEFPDYVDVTAAGPATINDYIALGYVLIKL